MKVTLLIFSICLLVLKVLVTLLGFDVKMKLILWIRKRRKYIHDVDEEYPISDKKLSSLAIPDVEE